MQNTESDREVYEALQQLLLWDTFPTLTVANLDYLFARIRRPDVNRMPPDQHRFWEATATKAVGDTVVPDPRPFTYDGELYTLGTVSYFTATVAGDTSSSQPDWDAVLEVGDTVVDGGVTWEKTGSALWIPTWDLTFGLSRGWMMKAQNVATQYDVSAAGQSLKRSQMFENCMRMADEWAKRMGTGAGTIKLTGSLARQAGRFPLTNGSSLQDFIDARDGFYSNYGFSPGIGRYEDF